MSGSKSEDTINAAQAPPGPDPVVDPNAPAADIQNIDPAMAAAAAAAAAVVALEDAAAAAGAAAAAAAAVAAEDTHDDDDSDDSDSSASWIMNDLEMGWEFPRADELLSDEEYWDSEEEAEGEAPLVPNHFPLFQFLPPELRMYVWEAYCPEMRADSRVLEFDVDLTRRRAGGPEECTVFNGIFLRTATHRTRKVLAVNRESRALVLGHLPDVLVFSHFGGLPEHDSIVHFSSARDVIYLKGFFDVPAHARLPPAFADRVVNLGVDVPLSSRKLNDKSIGSLLNFFGTLPRLRNVLYCQCTYEWGPEDLVWCADGAAFHRSYLKARDLYIDFCHLQTRTVMTVWPRRGGTKAFDGSCVPRKLADAARKFTQRAEAVGFEVLPMVFLDAKKEVKKYLEAEGIGRTNKKNKKQLDETPVKAVVALKAVADRIPDESDEPDHDDEE